MSLNTKNLTKTALSIGIITICAWITIPFAIPITLQTFGIFLMLRVIGGRNTLAAVICYILLGAVGMPVFSGFAGGIGYLAGPTGGFIIGFAATVILYMIFEKKATGALPSIIIMIVSQLLCYIVGTCGYLFLYAIAADIDTDIVGALMLCVIPFIIPDIIKIVCAYYLGEKLKKYIPD